MVKSGSLCCLPRQYNSRLHNEVVTKAEDELGAMFADNPYQTRRQEYRDISDDRSRHSGEMWTSRERQERPGGNSLEEVETSLKSKKSTA